MNIKILYGTGFANLLIIPRDWYTLKNYQSILMKVYYRAGLQELAKSCGFQSATLKSLESCSNFKRTHSFLLQVWEALYREMIHTYISQANHRELISNVKCFKNLDHHNNFWNELIHLLKN